MAMSASDNSLSQARWNEYHKKRNDLINHYQDILLNKSKSSTIKATNDIQLKKNTSNLFRIRSNAKNKIDVRNFNHVIQIDPQNLTADIEGMTSYEQIVKETLKIQCLPTVVPQLKSITIGGALAGGGIEASSFKYGLVHESILEFELLLGDGRVVLCTPNNEHSDLFYAFPNTYGTLGYALRVKVKLIPAKKYVKLNYSHFSDTDVYFAEIQKLCQQNRTITPNSTKKLSSSLHSDKREHTKNSLEKSSSIDYIDGVVFNQNDLVISTGQFTDEAPFTSNYKYLNIYYKSLKKKTTDYLTTEDYIWRWDTDWFWCSKHFFMQNVIMRLLFGKFFLNSITFWKIRNFFNRNKIAKAIINVLQGPTESVIQDVEIPIQSSGSFLNFFIRQIGVLPIWICPTQFYHNHSRQYDFYKMDPNTLYINFGFWDAVPTLHPDGFYNRKIEYKVNEYHGNKSLYSNVYYTPEEFWSIYDRKHYEQLKHKYDPNHILKDLYQKCTEKH